MRAGAHGGVCVLCASACLYRKEPTYSFRFQTSLISPAVPATLGRGSFRRRPTVLPSSPPARGSPPRHRAHRPPHGRCRGPGSARRAGTLSQRWVLCPYSLAHGRGKERIGGGMEEEPPGLEQRGWRCWKGLHWAGAASELGFAGGRLQSRSRGKGSWGGRLVNAARDVGTVEAFAPCPWASSVSHRARARTWRAGKPGCALPGVKLPAGS